MSGKDRAAIWLKRLVIAVCIAVIMLSAAIVAVRLQLTGPAEAALLVLLACLTAVLFVRQYMLQREVEAAKDLALEASMSAASARPSKSGSFERLGTKPETPAPTISIDDFPDGPSPKPAAPKREVKTALGKDDFVLFLQPIMRLPQKEPVFYQTVLRLKMAKGAMLDPPQYRQIALNGGLLAGIDRHGVTQSIRMLKTLHAMEKRASIFCTLSADSLKNSKNYDRMLSLLHRNDAVKADLVLEVNQNAWSGLGSAGRKRLQAIANEGYRLCMSELTNLDIDLDSLRKAGFLFLKVPVRLLTGISENGDGASYAGTLATEVALRDMHLVATGVADEQDVLHLLNEDVNTAQGGLFAAPKQVWAGLLAKN